jgi:N-acetyl-alpha-D-muramate 1-phosphate uridylyltransferase
LQRNIEYLQQFNIFDVVVNVHHFANQIVDAIEANKGWGSRISISDETDFVLETGGGLLKAKPLLEGFDDFVVMNCDILTNLNLNKIIEQHAHNQSISTLAVATRTTSRYLLFNENNKLIGWQNIKTNEIKLPGGEGPFTPLAFSGIHAISNKIFDVIQFSGKFSMIDLYLDLCPTQHIMAYNHSNDLVLDVGKPEAVIEAEKIFP